MSQKFELVSDNHKPFVQEKGNEQVATAWLGWFVSIFCGGWLVWGYSVVRNVIRRGKPQGEYWAKAGPFYIKENIPPRPIDKLRRPEKLLELYEFEMCPFCRKVREAIDHLDLNVLIRPCPKQGQIFRPELVKRGGKAQFPYLVDHNTGKEMYESDAIIQYLFKTYGPGESQIPWLLKLGSYTIKILKWSNSKRNHLGVTSRVGIVPDKPLIAYVYEGSPFCKAVKETLCELEIPYIRISVARGSTARQQVYSKYGHFQAPLLEDPNIGKAMFESKLILNYLNNQYSKKSR